MVSDSQGKIIRFDGIDVDITDHKQATADLEYHATHDPLTSLPNRALLMQKLEQALAALVHHPQSFLAVLFLDLDDFKVVNDSLGHMVGDQMLKMLTQRLQITLPTNYTIARFGGDEFIILIEDVKSNSEVITVAQQIHQTLTSPYLLNEQQVFINASIGIALSNDRSQTPQDLLRDADTAMYQAKNKGKGCYALFSVEMHHNAIQRLELESELRRAIEQQEFILYYQPIVSLQTGILTGFEALIRWRHPTRGMISPVDFIPIAEATGLIVSLGKWIFKEACRQLKIWQAKFPEYISLKMSINLSSKQLKDYQLIEELDEIFEEIGVDPRDIKLEITETLLMENVAEAMELLTAFRERQIELCLDDFGTGYSSLSYLHRFPVNTVKIDRSFVIDMQPDDSNTEIVRAIVTLAHTLGMDIIAEGIETELQLAQLTWLGCEYGQGYFYAQPLPPEAVEKLLRKNPHW